MRKTVFAFAAAFILFTSFGCKKDHDSVSLVGKWTLISETTKYYEGTSTTPDETETYDEAEDGVETYTFNADKTVVVDLDGDTEAYTYTYDPDSKKLTILEDGFGYAYDIKTLTSNSLTLHGDFTISDGTTSYRIVDDSNLKR